MMPVQASAPQVDGVTGPVPDAVDQLWAACTKNEFPYQKECLETFLFDRCLEWSNLLGLWQGMKMLSDSKGALRKAVAAGRVLEYMEELYKEYNVSSGYWKWYQQNKAVLKERATAAHNPPRVGHRVQLKGLQAQPELNGAVGKVVNIDAASGRLGVKLDSPPAAVAAVPEGVRVRPENAEVLPWPAGGARAVLVCGTFFSPAFAFGTRARDGWKRCQVPDLLGVPLAYRRMGLDRQFPDESAATWLTIDDSTGIASPDVLAGLGPVLVARIDGRDFTVEQMTCLHEFNKTRLMPLYAKPTPVEVMRRLYLTPAAYQAFEEAYEEFLQYCARDSSVCS